MKLLEFSYASTEQQMQKLIECGYVPPAPHPSDEQESKSDSDS